jgi:hypothetical protein
VKLTEMLRDGGPWALLAIALVALAYVSKQYVKARDSLEVVLKEMAQGNAKLLEDMVRVGEKQISSGDTLVKSMDAMTAELRGNTENLQKVQEQQRRLLREANLGGTD